MKRLFLALLLFIAALAGASYLYYTNWRSGSDPSKNIPYVPQSAALVYQVEAVGKQWAVLQQTAIAQELKHLPIMVAVKEGLHFFENLGIEKTVLDELPLVVSVHGLSEVAVDYAFYLNAHDVGTQAFLSQLAIQAKKSNTYSIEKRKYAGRTITKLSSETYSWQLHFIKQGPYLIVSFSPLLIEDIIRGLVQKESTAFLTINKSLNRQGSVYVNFSKLTQLLRVFFKNKYAYSLGAALSSVAQSGQLELKITNHHLLLNGFIANPDILPQKWVQVLEGQIAGKATLAPYIPQSTAWLQHYSFSDVTQLVLGWQQYQSGKIPESLDKIETNTLDHPLNHLIKGEIGLGTLGDGSAQLLFIQVDDNEALSAVLAELKLLAKPWVTPLNQLSAVYQVTPDLFSNWLPSKIFPDFQPHWLTMLDSHLILANCSTALEILKEQYKKGKTWANTMQQQSFFNTTLEQAHFSLWINTYQAWPLLINALKPTWQPLFETHAASCQRLEQASIQLIHEKQVTPTTSYLSLVLHHQEVAEPELAMQETALTTLQHFQAEVPIITQPFLVKTHKSSALHTLFQDSLYQAYFLDGRGKLIWKKALEGPIVTDIFAIDFYKNNKLQYLFATKDSLHLIDYHGRYIARYPCKLPSNGLVGLDVIDYNNDKNYRWLLADTLGDIYLRDQNNRPLPGWNPKVLRAPLAAMPFHIRVNLDYFLVLQAHGKLQAFNRKGKAYPGFPIDLAAPIHNPLIIKKSPKATNTSLVTLTDMGELRHWSLSGRLQRSIQLNNVDSTTRLILCPDGLGGLTYTIMRQDPDGFAFLDENGDLLFEKEHTASHQLLGQYYDFGVRKFYVITDPRQYQTCIYNSVGKAIHDDPLSSSHAVRLTLTQDFLNLLVYSNFKDQALQYLLPLVE